MLPANEQAPLAQAVSTVPVSAEPWPIIHRKRWQCNGCDRLDSKKDTNHNNLEFPPLLGHAERCYADCDGVWYPLDTLSSNEVMYNIYQKYMMIRAKEAALSHLRKEFCTTFRANLQYTFVSAVVFEELAEPNAKPNVRYEVRFGAKNNVEEFKKIWLDFRGEHQERKVYKGAQKEWYDLLERCGGPGEPEEAMASEWPWMLEGEGVPVGG